KFANTPLHITEEVVGLLLSVSLFLGLPMVTLQAKHVRVSLVADRFHGQQGKALNLIALIIAIVFFGWLLVETIPWFEFAFKRSIKTETARILLYPWMAMMPLAFIITLFILTARLFGIIPHGQDPKIEAALHPMDEAK
ncbi:MAG: TRAP transporter small permease, partial [Cohaesibacter sp.]|nr:TRAP transporter small permease [Cohaesibacter sp.]